MEYEIILDVTQQIFKVDEMRLYLYTDDWFFSFIELKNKQYNTPNNPEFQLNNRKHRGKLDTHSTHIYGRPLS